MQKRWILGGLGFVAFCFLSGIAALVVCLLLGLPSLPVPTGNETRLEYEPCRSTHSKAQFLDYALDLTVEYSGKDGRAIHTAESVISILKRKLSPARAEYVYSCRAEIGSGMPSNLVDLGIAPVRILLDPRSNRFTGGHALFKDAALFSNTALEAIRHARPTKPCITHQSFSFDLPPLFPRKVEYHLRFSPQKKRGSASPVAILATSEPIRYQSSDYSKGIVAVHRVLCVMDETTDDVLYQCSVFEARPVDSFERMRIESVMCLKNHAHALSVSQLNNEFRDFVVSLDLSGSRLPSESTTEMPIWAMHSVAVHDMAGLTASAAIEGRPNFAITATIGLVLLADSGVSAGTALLHEAGVIDREWKGIPNYVGQGVGLGAAGLYEGSTGYDVDEQHWAALGGTAGDVASLLIPSKALGTGAKLTLKGGKTVHFGAKVIRGKTLAGKALSISKKGIRIVKAGKGWLNSADSYSKLKTARDALSLFSTSIELTGTFETKSSNTARRESKPYSLVLIVDKSGSMSNDRKLEQAKQAARAVLHSLDPSEQVGIVSYDSSGYVNHPLARAGLPGILQSVSLLSASGGTDISAGLKTGYEQLIRSKPGKKAALLLADGQDPGQLDSVLRKYIHDRIPVYTVAFGDDAEKRTLKNIAAETDGMFVTADKGSLIQAFWQILNSSRSDTDLAFVRDIILPRETKSHVISVPPRSENLRASLSWLGSRLGLRLLSPSGKRITLEGSTSDPRIHFVKDLPNNLICLTIKEPQSGMWRFVAGGLDVPEKGELYSLNVAASAPWNTRLLPLEKFYRPGQTARLGISVPEAYSFKASVEGILHKKKDHDLRLPLNDSGRKGDAEAGDGIHSCTLRIPPHTHGLFPVSFNLNGPPGRHTVWATLQVGRPGTVNTSSAAGWTDPRMTVPRQISEADSVLLPLLAVAGCGIMLVLLCVGSALMLFTCKTQRIKAPFDTRTCIDILEKQI